MRLGPWRLFLVLFALVAGQALAVLHGVAHAEPGTAHRAGQEAAHAGEPAAAAAGRHWTARLFSSHAPATDDCQAGEHGPCAGLAPVAAAVQPLPPADLAAEPAAGVAATPGWSCFDARAPPLPA